MVSPALSPVTQHRAHQPDKDAPTEPWIDYLRRRYPTESELDRVLI